MQAVLAKIARIASIFLGGTFFLLSAIGLGLAVKEGASVRSSDLAFFLGVIAAHVFFAVQLVRVKPLARYFACAYCVYVSFTSSHMVPRMFVNGEFPYLTQLVVFCIVMALLLCWPDSWVNKGIANAQ